MKLGRKLGRDFKVGHNTQW